MPVWVCPTSGGGDPQPQRTHLLLRSREGYEALMDRLEDLELNMLADARLKDGKRLVKVKLDEL